MNNKENLTLINGSFHPTEAQELLLNVFSTKIQFHHLKKFQFERTLWQRGYGLKPENITA